MTPEQHAEKLRQARLKHGKPFAHEQREERKTPLSWYLQNVIMKKAQKESKVTKLRRDNK